MREKDLALTQYPYDAVNCLTSAHYILGMNEIPSLRRQETEKYNQQGVAVLPSSSLRTGPSLPLGVGTLDH